MDRWIRRATSAVVITVAVFAAIVSYSHIYDLGRAHGQTGTAARLLPLSVDGLILAASLVMLHEARAARHSPALARSMLGLGVLATVAANVAYGAAYGLLGALISAWPAVAFVGAAELAIGLVRRTGRQVARPDPGAFPSAVPDSAENAARMAFEASHRGGNPLSMNQLTTRFGVTRTQARRILSAANGHGPGDG